MANSFSNDGSGTGFNSTDETPWANPAGGGNSGFANTGSGLSAAPGWDGTPGDNGYVSPTQRFVNQDGSAAADPYNNGMAEGAVGNPRYTAMFDAGGSTDPDDMQGQPDATDNSGDRLADALTSVDAALQFGRGKYGLPNDSEASDGSGSEGQNQVAANMPSAPGTPSDSGVLRPQPTPGPLPPTSNPFGKRDQYAQNMPSVPGNPSDSGMPRPQPMPGPLPPTSNPFGKRSPYASNDDDSTAQMDEDA